MNATTSPYEKHPSQMVPADRRTMEALPARQGWGEWGFVSVPGGGAFFRCELQQGASRDLAVEGNPEEGWWLNLGDRSRPYPTGRDNAIRAALLPMQNAGWDSPEAAMEAVDAAIARA